MASLLPVNANGADLAARCIAARAHAEDALRLLRENAGDIALVIRLNAQYASMVRTSLSAHARLMRVQAVRKKREASGGTPTEDAPTLPIVEQPVLKMADAGFEGLRASPRAARGEAPKAAPDEARAPRWNPRIGANAS